MVEATSIENTPACNTIFPACQLTVSVLIGSELSPGENQLAMLVFLLEVGGGKQYFSIRLSCRPGYLWIFSLMMLKTVIVHCSKKR